MTSTAPVRIPSDVRVTSRTEHGAVALSISTGSYHSLNPTSAAILDDVRSGEGPSLDRFCLDYADVDRETLAADYHSALAALLEQGLIEPGEPVAERPSSTRRGGPQGAPDTQAPVRPGALAAGTTPRLFAVVVLALADAAIAVCSFSRLHQIISRLGTVGRRRHHASRARALVSLVEGAARLYPRETDCLPRSVATVTLCRLYGYPADLVLGVHQMPFMAHAWVELDGEVLNDESRVRSFYQVIDRL